jgi:tetratricopeptide (TPR) repeat protein
MDGAIADYSKAIKLKADFPGAYYNRGNAKQAKGDLHGAIADFSKAIEFKPDLADAYNNRGYVKKSKGDLDGVIADYIKAIELKPNSAVAYYNRSDAKQAKGDLDGANADRTRATEIDSRLDQTTSPQTPNLSAHTGTGPKAGGSQPAGGKWTYDIGEDKLTGALYGNFSLEGDEAITDGIASVPPSFVIMCGGPLDSPHWLNSELLSPVVLRMPATKSPFGAPQQRVHLRADSSVFVHRLALLLHASFRPRLAAAPLRFANPSPPSGWVEDFHLQAVKHARHTGLAQSRISSSAAILAGHAQGPSRQPSSGPSAGSEPALIAGNGAGEVSSGKML